MSILRSLTPPLLAQAYSNAMRTVYNRGGYGLNALDIKVINIIKPRQEGFFVELGANDGIRQSNTYVLQKKYKWGGVLIEPNPARYEECVANRSSAHNVHTRCCACVPFSYHESSIEMINGDLMSVAMNLDLSKQEAMSHALSGTEFLRNPGHSYNYFATAKTLTEVLNSASSPNHIDFLSLDVEGNELAVLEGLDTESYFVDWILIETRSDATKKYLSEKGYVEIHAFSSKEREDILFRRFN